VYNQANTNWILHLKEIKTKISAKLNRPYNLGYIEIAIIPRCPSQRELLSFH